MLSPFARIRYALLLLVLCALPVHAQSLLGVYGAGCGTLTGSGPTAFEITLNQSAPAGSHMFAAVALDVGLFQFTNLTVYDSVSTVYSNGAASFDNSAVSVVYDRYLDTGLNSGDVVGVRTDNNPGVRACLLLAVFADVMPQTGPNASAGSASSAGSTSPSATTAGSVSTVPYFAMMATTFKGDPGTINTPASATLLGKICSGGGTPLLCLYSAYQVPGTVGTPSIALTTQNSVPWNATIDAYFGQAIFRDGFE